VSDRSVVPPRLAVDRRATAARAAAPGPEPYRVLFPPGVVFALWGAGTWLAASVTRTDWPGPLHIMLMTEGFALSFVAGFLLTAMPAFTRGPRCRRGELIAVALFLSAFGMLAALGWAWAAHLASAATLALVGWALTSRVARSRQLPPEEFLFVALGLLLGLAGLAVQVAQSAFGLLPPAPRWGERLVSLGLLLPIVLGVGGLLVPTFAGLRDPQVIPGVARPHERGGRRALFVAIAIALSLSFALDALGRPGTGSLLRAASAGVMVVLVWKAWRRPRAGTRMAWALLLSGWLVVVGLWLAVLWPAQETTAWHLAFIGGYGLLVAGIATRVTVAHGRHPSEREGRLLSPLMLTALAAALLARLAAGVLPARALDAHGLSASLWMIAWATWAVGAAPLLARPAPGPGPR
jgi:uncharacterized protein involved in response to NO